ncbi:MAG: hypothetical protein WB816_03840 [Methylocystis sp.]
MAIGVCRSSTCRRSAAVIELIRDAVQTQMATITLGFDDPRGASSNEALLGERVAKNYGASHTRRLVDATEVRGEQAESDHLDQKRIMELLSG